MTNTISISGFPTIGAEISGVDRDRLAHDEELPGVVLDALERYGVVVFRRLMLDDDRQLAFCRRLGDVAVNPNDPVPGIFHVSLDPARSSSAAYLRGTFSWHIDGTTTADPPVKATLLTAHAVAAEGGDTEFASTYRAYDDLSDDERRQCASRRVVHSVAATLRRVHPNPTPEQEEQWLRSPSAEHPLVWRHRSGRHSLVLGATASHIVGMDRDDGERLLDDLLDRATRPELVYRHTWTVGDTVIWDNRGVLHRALPYDDSSPRDMHRTTLLGDEPIA